jgi:hypothetical protein
VRRRGARSGAATTRRARSRTHVALCDDLDSCVVTPKKLREEGKTRAVSADGRADVVVRAHPCAQLGQSPKELSLHMAKRKKKAKKATKKASKKGRKKA